jgi:hypothetical protein
MNIDFSSHDIVHLLGESATHPIELRCGALAALLLLAGTSPQRSRLASAPHHSPLGRVQLPFLG